MDPKRHALAVAFLAGEALDMDNVFETVDGDDFAFAAFAGAAGYQDFVVFADGDGADLEGEGVLTGVIRTLGRLWEEIEGRFQGGGDEVRYAFLVMLCSEVRS